MQRYVVGITAQICQRCRILVTKNRLTSLYIANHWRKQCLLPYFEGNKVWQYLHTINRTKLSILVDAMVLVRILGAAIPPTMAILLIFTATELNVELVRDDSFLVNVRISSQLFQCSISELPALSIIFRLQFLSQQSYKVVDQIQLQHNLPLLSGSAGRRRIDISGSILILAWLHNLWFFTSHRSLSSSLLKVQGSIFMLKLLHSRTNCLHNDAIIKTELKACIYNWAR